MQYVPQRPSILPGTPQRFLETVLSFKSRKGTEKYSSTVDGPVELAERWGIDNTCWDRPCSSVLYALERFIYRYTGSSLSGGEVQRIALALAVGIPGAEILLLDGM